MYSIRIKCLKVYSINIPNVLPKVKMIKNKCRLRIARAHSNNGLVKKPVKKNHCTPVHAILNKITPRKCRRHEHDNNWN